MSLEQPPTPAASGPEAVDGVLFLSRVVLDWTAGPGGLVTGIAAICLAIIGVGIFVAFTAVRGRSARSLAAIDTVRNLAPDARAHEIERPFGERILEPSRLALIRLGRWITPAGHVARIQRRLGLAGNPPDWDVDRVIALQVLAATLCGALGSFLALLLNPGILRSVAFIAIPLAIGWLLPTLFIYQMASTRSQRLLRDLPDSLDLLTISVEAGLSFDAALSYVARNGRGPMAREFARVLQEMQIGTGRGEALRSLAQRVDVSEVRSFASAMNQADTFGVPIAKALRGQADEMRIRRRQRAEEKAQQVPVKILFPLIFGILPVLFIAIIGPAAVQAFRTFSTLGGP